MARGERTPDWTSKYVRRSAHLPHIGDQASRDALRSMRKLAPKK